MWPVATDTAAWSVTVVSPAKTAEPIEIPFGMCTRVVPRNRVLDAVQIPTHEGAILRAMRGRPGTCQDMSIYSKWLSRGQNRHGVHADWGVLDGGTHWRHLANTTEPSVNGGDPALCRITLTLTTTIHIQCQNSAASPTTCRPILVRLGECGRFGQKLQSSKFS